MYNLEYIVQSRRIGPEQKMGMDELSKAIQGLAAALVSVAIAASVAYETGYFSIIGSKYQGILSAGDYLSSALEWLPWLSILYGVGLVAARASSHRLVEIGDRLPARRRYVLAMLVTILITSMGMLAVIPFYQVLLYMPVAALPAIAAPLFVKLSSATGDPAQKLTAIAVSSIAMMIALYCSGVGKAHRDLTVIDNAYVIRSGSDAGGAQVLRTLQKGLLVWKPQDNKIDLIGWEKIERTTHVIWMSQDAPWLEPLGCKIWGTLCSKQPIIP